MHITIRNRAQYMPQYHSNLFTQLTTKTGTEYRLNSQQLKTELDQGIINYDQMVDLLLETNDAQFGIVSTVNENNEWVRDATQSLPLAARMSHEAPVIEANNALLRCLSRLRAIDYAIHKTAADLQAGMRTHFSQLTTDILTIAQDATKDNAQKLKEILHEEKQFNTFLIEQLHTANLTTGCESRKDAEALLFHYRILSTALTPTRTVITLTYDEKAKILQRETQYPVTEKTAKQQEQLVDLTSIKPYPNAREINSHTSHPVAMQEADNLFAENIAKNDRELPAQARKTHLAGIRNAYIVKSELIPLEKLPESLDAVSAQKAIDANTLWLARSGSPVYLGEGEKDKIVQLHTKENLNQIRQTAAKHMGKDASNLKLHITTLNTNSPLEDQSTIIKHVYEATRHHEGNSDDVSYMPTNSDGTFRLVDIAEDLKFQAGTKPSGISPLQKSSRLNAAVKVMLHASDEPNTVSLVHCASGKDRTGTAVEKATQEWMTKRYKAMNIDDQSHIEESHVRGGNAAYMASHLEHGSGGMKSDSIADNLFDATTTFSPQATKELYRKSADTNKSNKVGNVDFLKKPSTKALEQYQQNIDGLRRLLEDLETKDLFLYKKVKALYKQVLALATPDPSQIEASTLYDLNLVLATTSKGLKERGTTFNTRHNSLEMANLARHVSGKGSPLWEGLGVLLFTVACSLLIAVGLLAAVPTLGSSTFLAAAGGVGLATMATGSFLFFNSQEKGLAKAVSELQEQLDTEDVNPPRLR